MKYLRMTLASLISARIVPLVARVACPLGRPDLARRVQNLAHKVRGPHWGTYR